MSAIWVEIVATRGSAPRDAGTAMKVTPQGCEGTIGGGALEWAAMARAREMLASDAPEETRRFPLGPNLGQCCGGAVTLRFTRSPRATDADGPPAARVAAEVALVGGLWLWGAGHVGRAVVRAVPPGAGAITWVDSAPERFPAQIPAHVTALPAADMPRLAARAPADAHHLVFTYSHEIDLALCAALLRRGFASCGLIGSATKWARFSRRLRAAGLDPAPITCPIGDKSLGKTPAAIAQGVVAALLRERNDA
ncbi:xanthine dehydrogenase accessory protein XdhC [Roseovarius spongiae]|uniref:Xanthine dehydrogenase accessory protein XdhC n=1 Tax=Roseovarius spongiae TaxID=2320272 RepID=A0A3A8AT78_9RHOB|nr:xanthine dehydrogenase accessory protein XdhC [Roseovarius spongiae]RKF13790.1 xanthine dehydrogenase accessory protein XdhC [Roseovarius spongiae]